ncbi:MAG TPA: hypothetical protein VKE22_00445 [Haliangiales bacterium]|nr:hypothetical protein [Haliangiales bacterium]
MRLLYLAAAYAATQLATGCARWPSVTAVGDVGFMRHGGAVGTVELLPVDVGVAVYPESPATPEEVAGRFDAAVRAAVGEALASHGFRMTAAFDSEGVPLYSADELRATAQAFAAFGREQAVARQLLSPELPAQLGRSGADATLYIGGLAYAGEDNGMTASDVAKAVFIALFVIVVIVIAIAAAKRGGGGGGGGKGAPAATPAPGHPVGALRAAATRGTLRIAPPRAGVAVRAASDVEVPMYGPSGQPLPGDGESCLALQMTLVDNRTGATLWHIEQAFAATPADDDQVREAVRRMMMTLPEK